MVGKHWTKSEIAFLKENYSKGKRKYVGNGEYQSVHRLVWISANNQEIPKGYQVHHIDGNKRNNNPDNLILLSEREHKKLHRAQERLEKIKKKWNFNNRTK